MYQFTFPCFRAHGGRRHLEETAPQRPVAAPRALCWPAGDPESEEKSLSASWLGFNMIPRHSVRAAAVVSEGRETAQ